MKRILHVSSDLKGLFCCKILLCFLRIWDDTQWNGEEFLWRRGGRDWGAADQQTGNRAPRATLQVMMSLFITFVNCFWMPWGGRGAVQTLKWICLQLCKPILSVFFYYRVFFITVPPKKNMETRSIPKQQKTTHSIRTVRKIHPANRLRPKK